MPNEIDLAVAIRVPKINGQNVERCIDFTSNGHIGLITRNLPPNIRSEEKGTYLISISFCVAASRTISLTHGGGVIGLRS